MIAYANAKINIGLNITAKRGDGYHLLQTVLYPFPLYDIIELRDATDGRTSLRITGMDLPVDENNLCLKAFRLLRDRFDLPDVQIHLHKQIPFGAGLGGGSADGAFVLKMLNDKFQLQLSWTELEVEAAKLGADCPFFIQNVPMYAEGIGTTLSPLALDLSNRFLVLVKPAVHVSTAEAYRGIVPQPAPAPLRDLVQLPIQDWKYYIKNDFEDGIFDQYPEIRAVKLALYEKGALYAAMSGSGSAVYGVFTKRVDLSRLAGLGQVYYPVVL